MLYTFTVGLGLGRQRIKLVARLERLWRTMRGITPNPWTAVRAVKSSAPRAVNIDQSFVNTHLVCFSRHGVLDMVIARNLYMIAHMVGLGQRRVQWSQRPPGLQH